MDKEEEGYKFPSRFYLLVTMKDKRQVILGTASLQGFTEQSVERHLMMATMLPNVLTVEVKEVQSLFEQAP